MKLMRNMAMLLLLTPMLAMAQAGDDGDVKTLSTDEVVSIEQVPERVAETARAAKPGAFFTRITRKLKRDDEFYYRFDASQVGRYWVIMVRTDGKLMEVYEETSPPRPLRD